jgi:hypothetical protein
MNTLGGPRGISSGRWRRTSAQESWRRGGLDTSTPDVAKIHDFMPGAGRTAADRDAAASIMKEMPHRALSGSGGIRREKELR